MYTCNLVQNLFAIHSKKVHLDVSFSSKRKQISGTVYCGGVFGITRLVYALLSECYLWNAALQSQIVFATLWMPCVLGSYSHTVWTFCCIRCTSMGMSPVLSYIIDYTV